MRLTCPNCQTEYEVQASMIPPAGRDVQCSNCMKTWFQPGPSQAAPETAADLQIDAAAPPPPPPEKAVERPQPKPETEARIPAPASPPDDAEYEDEEDSGLPSAVAAVSARRSAKLDADAKSIIDEEVSRERTARKAEADQIETQIDLGIDDSEIETRAAAARERMSRQHGSKQAVDDEIVEVDVSEPEVHEEEIATEPSNKRELLPDIEEINSTLADAPDHDDLDEYMDLPPQKHPKTLARRGFRLGFGLMLLLAACLVGLYVYAPIISARAPSLAEPLQSYVAVCDQMRAWLDRSAQDLVEQITKLLGNVNA